MFRPSTPLCWPFPQADPHATPSTNGPSTSLPPLSADHPAAIPASNSSCPAANPPPASASVPPGALAPPVSSSASPLPPYSAPTTSASDHPLPAGPDKTPPPPPVVLRKRSNTPQLLILYCLLHILHNSLGHGVVDAWHKDVDKLRQGANSPVIFLLEMVYRKSKQLRCALAFMRRLPIQPGSSF